MGISVLRRLLAHTITFTVAEETTSEVAVLVQNAVTLLLRAGPAILGAIAITVAMGAAAEVAVARALPGNTIAPLVPFYAAVAWAQIAALVGLARALERTPTVRECLLGAVGTPRALMLMVVTVSQGSVLLSSTQGMLGWLPNAFLLPMMTLAHAQLQLEWTVGRVTGKTTRREILEEATRVAWARRKLFVYVTRGAMLLWASALLPRIGIVPSLGFVGTVVPLYYFMGVVAFGVGFVSAALVVGLVALVMGIDLHAEPEATPSAL